MSNEVYFNRPQLYTQLIGANTTVVVAGRRTGKTDGIAAPWVLRNMQRMPGSTGGIVVPTFKHGMTNTIPGMFAAWKRWRFEKGIHYVVGRRPPEFFAKPIKEPETYEHVISFYNGAVAILLSQDRPGAANSLTLSWVLVDEAKFVDYPRLKDEVFPANGGDKTAFGKHSYNNSMLILSDMPVSKKGSWFLHYKDKMDRELIRGIEGLLCEIWRTRCNIEETVRAGNRPKDYLKKKLRSLDRSLNRLRAEATLYKQYSSIENIQLIGEKYIRQMKRDLTPLTFQTSIMCQPIGIAKDGFYSNFRERHQYDASDFEFLDSLGGLSDVAPDPTAIDSRADADVDPNAPICIGMDYNANINWIVAGQPRRSRLNVIKSFFVKFDRKIPALIQEFCTYYAHHKEKTVVFYYDTTALGSNYAVNKKDFAYVIREEFLKYGWNVIPVFIGNPMRHPEKYLLINEGFAGHNRLTPFFNRQNNESLILAISTAGVRRGPKGLHKDKSGEKLAESEEDLLELRTDGTDAFDTLYIGCENFPQIGGLSFSASGIY